MYINKMYTVILGKGYIGSQLIHHFEKNKIEYKAFSRYQLDYANPEIFRDFLANETSNIKTVINCFGYTGSPNVDACEDNKEKCYEYNVLYPLNVVKTCHHLSIPVIQVASGCIYNGYNKNYTEEDVPNFGFYSEDSSYYSKCKHLFETLVKDYNAYTLRIRIPFNSDRSIKNYFTKLLRYKDLINETNSVTSVQDFCKFIKQFPINQIPYGIYNVVNPQPIKAEQVIDILKKYQLQNQEWNFIKTENLKTKAKRSNCVLSTDKIESLGLSMPNTLDSLERDIKTFKNNE